MGWNAHGSIMALRGRPAAGLPPVAYDPAGKLDITKPAFDAQNAGTWGYTARPRLVFGLGVKSGRLYYGVADNLQVWSVSIAPGGARRRPAPRSRPFRLARRGRKSRRSSLDGQGRMILGERASPTGAVRFRRLSRRKASAACCATRRPAGRTRSGRRRRTNMRMSFPLGLRNGDGGVAIGYDYTPAGGSTRGVRRLPLVDRRAVARLGRSRDGAAPAPLGPELSMVCRATGLDLVRPRTRRLSDLFRRLRRPLRRSLRARAHGRHRDSARLLAARRLRRARFLGELFGGLGRRFRPAAAAVHLPAWPPCACRPDNDAPVP